MREILQRVSTLENRLIDIDGHVRKVFKLSNEWENNKDGKHKNDV